VVGLEDVRKSQISVQLDAVGAGLALRRADVVVAVWVLVVEGRGLSRKVKASGVLYVESLNDSFRQLTRSALALFAPLTALTALTTLTPPTTCSCIPP
jgi:hypothetical protein